MEALYAAWNELLGWMREYAKEKGARFVVEADFPNLIYRLHKPTKLPTPIMSASLAYPNEERFLLAAVSPPQARDAGVEIRLVKAHVYLHLHLGEEGLEYEGRPLTKRRFFQLAETAEKALRPLAQ